MPQIIFSHKGILAFARFSIERVERSKQKKFFTRQNSLTHFLFTSPQVNIQKNFSRICAKTENFSLTKKK